MKEDCAATPGLQGTGRSMGDRAPRPAFLLSALPRPECTATQEERHE